MKNRLDWNRITQWAVVLLIVLALKQYYSTASADGLRWILAPTTALVELATGAAFEFEPGAGYISDDRTFLIAPSCAGVNFLITAFLMLAVGKLLRDRSRNIGWRFIPAVALVAYVATLAANTVRIAIALRMHRTLLEIGWLNPDQLHRVEGIAVYFGFLLLLFVLSERFYSGRSSTLLRRPLVPLLLYYTIAFGLPLVNGAYHQGSSFWEHSIFVLLIPLVLVLPLVAFRHYAVARARNAFHEPFHLDAVIEPTRRWLLPHRRHFIRDCELDH